MKKIFTILSIIRAHLFRFLRPRSTYWLAQKSTSPISRKFGFDRGTPIDRFWIEAFIKTNKSSITGRVLEIGDNRYTKKYGTAVSTSDILDVDKRNTSATIIGDLRNLEKKIKTSTYDCIILTHVLGQIDDIDAALAECKRILKPGGVLLATSACISPTHGEQTNYWRFTPSGAAYIFKKQFSSKNLSVSAYGNALTGQSFWVGLSQEDLSTKELAFNDPEYPCIVGITARK